LQTHRSVYAIKKDDNAAMTPTMPKDIVVVGAVEGGVVPVNGEGVPMNGGGIPVKGGGVPVAITDGGEAVSSLVGAACGGAEIRAPGARITVSVVATGDEMFLSSPTPSQPKAQFLIKSTVS
jgi:hypothetical protein